MRIGLGTALLLAASSLVGLTQSPVAAATGCEAPDTTWVGPATPDGSASWNEPSNWDSGIPTAESVVCIPAEVPGPVVQGTTAVAGVIDANGATVTLLGTLTVGTTFDVAVLVGGDPLATLVGPATTVSENLTGDLTLDGVVLDQLEGSTALLGDWRLRGDARLNIRGEAVLSDGATIDSFGAPGAGLFKITDTGALTLGAPDANARVQGGFANNGRVTVTADQWLMMLGASPEDAKPDQFSTGTFTATGESFLDVGYTELHDGAHLDGVTVDNIAVPRGSTVTVAASYMRPMQSNFDSPSIHGEGDLVLTDETVVDETRFGGSLTVTVPAGEVVTLGSSAFQDQARLQVYGELLQENGLLLENNARLDVHGVHRAVRGTAVHYSGADPGLEVIHPGGQLLADEDAGLIVLTPFINRGTVDSGNGFFYIGPEIESPESSSGIFRAGGTGSLGLGYPFEGGPQFAMDQAVVEGEVDVYGRVRANALQVRGHLSTGPGGATWPPGRLELGGTTTIADGASVAGDVLVSGTLDADLGPTGTATLDGAQVNGRVRVVSGTLSVPSLAAATLLADGTLVGGHWTAGPGATLELPAVTTNDARLVLEGPGASFGEGLAALRGTGATGKLKLLGGADLTLPRAFGNDGVLRLAADSRLRVGGRFAQSPTGKLVTEVAAVGFGGVRASGRHDLAGVLVVEPEPSYAPSVGTEWALLASSGQVSQGERFDDVVSPKFESRRIRPTYEADRVRLRVYDVG